MIIVRAVFKGAQGSMGYFKGSEYRLKIYDNTIIPLHDEAKSCPYTLEGFLVNWIIKEVEYPRERGDDK